MLDKLTRYLRHFGPAPAAPQGEAAASSGGVPVDGTVRDLMVEGAVAPALREVFAQERTRTASGQVITLYDPQRAFTPILPRLIEAAHGTPGDRIRLVDARSRRALAVIDRALLSANGSVLRLLEVDLAAAEHPSRDVPLTLIEQSDIGVVLMGAEPDATLLEALAAAARAPTWRCSALVLVVPRDAEHALARLSPYTWPAGTRTETIIDPAIDLPRLLTAALRRPAAAATAAAGAGDGASHTERISQMLAAVAAPPAAPVRADAALHVTALARPHTELLRGSGPLHSGAPGSTLAPEAGSLAHLVLDPSAPPLSTPTRIEPEWSPTMSPVRSAKPLPEPATAPRFTPAAGDAAAAILEPVMRLPGAIAVALLDLRDARLGAQLGAATALAAAQSAVLIGCRPLALAAERIDRISEWTWVAAGRQHVLQPLTSDPLSALLVVVDAERCDVAMTRWSCTVARNALDHNAAVGAPAARTDTASSPSSGR